MPIFKQGNLFLLAVSDLTLLKAEEEFRFATGLHPELALADHRALQAAIRRLYGSSIQGEANQRKEFSQDELATLVKVSDDELQSIEDRSQDESPSVALSTKCCSMRCVKAPRIFILSRMKASIGSACAAMAVWSKLSNRLAI